MKFGLILFSASLISFAAAGQSEHQQVRRITVFPLKAGKEVAKAADEAWWKVREALTENQRFLVASRNFLVQKDVYQARGELKPADAVILGKLLDAQAMVTTFLEDRILSMRVYESEYGRLLWSHDFRLHPSLPISDQLVGATKKLIYDFISSIPYQGFVIVDSLNPTAVFNLNGKPHVKVFVGTNSKVSVGDIMQVMRMDHDSIRPLFTPESIPEIYAEGEVKIVEGDSVTVEIKRQSKGSPIIENALVRFPNELKRLKDAYAINDQFKTQIGTEYYSPEMTPHQQVVAERKPLVTALTFILNLAAFLLIAF